MENNKVIYLVPEPGVEGFKQGYNDHSIDLPFNIDRKYRLIDPNLTYQIPLGCRTYAPADCGGLFLMPRSKCSLLWPKEWLKPSAFNRLTGTEYKGVALRDAPEQIQAYEACDLSLTNTIGYIDYSYRGEWMARCKVRGRVTIEPGKPLFQAVPLNTEYTIMVVNSINDVPRELRETERGDGGFGSSDKVTSTKLSEPPASNGPQPETADTDGDRPTGASLATDSSQ